MKKGFPSVISKEILRNEWKEKRERLSLSRRKKAALDLSEMDIQGFIGSFASFGTEIDTAFLNGRLAQEKRLLLPKILDKRLVFFHVEDIHSQLSVSCYNILEPVESRCLIASKFDMILVPALVFDHDFFRLGYGGFFYDRFLENNPIIYSVGVGFKEQLVVALPRDPWDRAVNQLYLV
jgi:5-formyltetrahydrofolate cyclo-ligase